MFPRCVCSEQALALTSWVGCGPTVWTPREWPPPRAVGCRSVQEGPDLLQPPALLLLLLDALLTLGQQLPLMLLVLPLLLLQLLPPQGLRPLLVGQLQPQEVPPQRRLPRQVQNGAAGRRQRSGLPMGPGQSSPLWVLRFKIRANISLVYGERSHMLKHRLLDPLLIMLLTPKETE